MLGYSTATTVKREIAGQAGKIERGVWPPKERGYYKVRSNSR